MKLNELLQNNQVQLYCKEYKKHYKKNESQIKSILVNPENQDYDFSYLSALIADKIKSETTTSKIFNGKYRSLINVFQKRNDKFKEEYSMKILIEDMPVEYQKIPNPKISYSNLIIELAKVEANKHVLNRYRNNNIIFQKMYELKKFDNYINMKTFEIVNYSKRDSQQVTNTDIFKELLSIENYMRRT